MSHFSKVLLLLCTIAVFASATTVQISGRQLLVNGRPFFMKGVDYSPIPIGHTAGDGYNPFTNAAIYNRDIPLIAGMGANTIRLYGVTPNSYNAYKPFLDACYSNGIYVLIGNWIDPASDFGNQNTRNNLKSDYLNIVSEYKNHPAVLLWLFGNELSTQTGNYQGLFSLIQEVTQACHQLEGGNWHPVASPLADINLNTMFEQYDSYVDLWAVQIYRGPSFYGLFSDYSARSGKPMIITEFGKAALNNDQATQNSWDTSMFNEMVSNSGVCSGGCVFSYVDEWWKGGNDGSQSNSNPEAWYGLFSASQNSNGGSDIVTARQVYYSLQNLYKTKNPY